MNTRTHSHYKDILSAQGFRVTEGRIKLLSYLNNTKTPVTVQNIKDSGVVDMDKVTLYRALEDFTTKGLVTEVTFPGMATHYELARDASHHHHHIVCTLCGMIEDIKVDEDMLLAQATKHSQAFKKISSHTLEFFGICKTCSARS